MNDVRWVSVPIKNIILSSPEKRLNATSYSIEGIRAKDAIKNLKKQRISIKQIDDLSERVSIGARSKRIFTPKGKGLPYLMPSDIFLFNLKPRKWISPRTKDIQNWKVSEGTILITQSGTPGRSIIATKLFEGMIVSQNVIRVRSNPDIRGYLYAYLNTWIGKALMLTNQYGGAVKHLDPDHIKAIPVPLLDDEMIRQTTKKILKAHKMREEAQIKLAEAEELFYQELGLPRIDEDDVEYFGGEAGKKVKAFTVKASELDLRFDASYHVPISRKIQEEIIKTGTFAQFKEIVSKIFVPSRFKRVYVESDKGIPFLQGSHLPLVKFFDIKYLWKKAPNIESLLIKRGWILMSRSGTVGNVALATKPIENWAASEHVIRIVPKDDVNPGYLWTALTSIYGQVQIKAKIYGGVVDEIAEKDTSLLESILLPLPDKSIQDKIGNLVIEAYELKDKANILEQEAVSMLEKHLEELSGVSL